MGIGNCLCVSAVSVLCLHVRAAPAATPDSQPSIDSLRSDLAMNFDDATAHLYLAKVLNQEGEAVSAFLICEHARTLFGDDAFHAAFDIVFRGHVTDVLFHARKQVLQATLKLEPQSLGLLKQMADLYFAHGQPDDAASYLARARALAPDDYSLVQAQRLALSLAGDAAGAQTLLNQWCTAHPDSAPAWEARVSDALSQNSDSAAATLDQAIGKCPQDGQLHLLRAKLEEDQKAGDAEVDYVAAAKDAADSSAAQGAAARFFWKVRHDPERALNYYLATYFLDPDFNDWESVDQRVRDAADEIAQTKLAATKSAGTGLAVLLSDPNPLVQLAAMDQLQAGVGDELAGRLLRLTTSDAPDVREAATASLVAHPESLPREQVEQMRKSQDAWQRAAAAALLAGTQSETSLNQLAPFFTDPSVLVRFTAATALVNRGRAGREIVSASTRKERDPWLRSTIGDLLAQSPQ